MREPFDTARAVLRVAAAALASAGLAAFPAQAELAYEEILSALPGAWEIDPAELDPAAFTDDAASWMRCDRNPLSIAILETDEGLVYEGSYIGRDGDEHRSLIRSQPFAILVKYDDETRTTPTGEIVEWYLLMPDRNRHYWVRADWLRTQPGARTGMFRRCPDGPIS